MIYKLKNLFSCSLFVTILLAVSGFAGDQVSGEQWQDPFPSARERYQSSPDSLKLNQVLSLVAAANPSLKAGLKRIEAAEGLMMQAGLWPNPELEVEVEEVGWDAPGLQESEITVLLSQEIQLWGNRRNRRLVARREFEATQLQTQVTAFDIHAIAVERYYTLSHAQRRVALAQESVDLATDIAESARARIDMGASMLSELLLGQLEIEIAALELADAMADLETARTELSSLWQGDASEIVAANVDFDPAVLKRIEALQSLLNGSRDVRFLEAETSLADAELNLQRSGSKPSISISGGYKRIEADGFNSFVLGVGLPLPFLDRNQGSIRALEARKDALRLLRQQALVTSRVEFETSKRRIEQQTTRYHAIKTRVLPKAEEAYLSLKSAYEKGRLPYSTLLEAQRMLLDLRFEQNDIELSIRRETGAIERLLGVTIQ
ncbi:MAG: TolC family protein [Candidatus Zixiibacteriota bacterium]